MFTSAPKLTRILIKLWLPSADDVRSSELNRSGSSFNDSIVMVTWPECGCLSAELVNNAVIRKGSAS